ncbi:MAG: hypothetical protein K0S65_4443 [Labilithrix sp.]|nr:hypothetical protein [Labilithrix sp.]
MLMPHEDTTSQRPRIESDRRTTGTGQAERIHEFND